MDNFALITLFQGDHFQQFDSVLQLMFIQHIYAVCGKACRLNEGHECGTE